MKAMGGLLDLLAASCRTDHQHLEKLSFSDLGHVLGLILTLCLVLRWYLFSCSDTINIGILPKLWRDFLFPLYPFSCTNF